MVSKYKETITLSDNEVKFRLSVLDSDKKRLLNFLLLSMIISAFYSLLNLLEALTGNEGSSERLIMTFSMLIFVAFSYRAVSHIMSPLIYDFAALTYLTFLAVFFISLHKFRPVDFVGTFYLSAIMSFYLLVPIRSSLQLIPSSILSFGMIYIIIAIKEFSAIGEDRVAIIAIILTNIMGYIGSYKIGVYRRNEFSYKIDSLEFKDTIEVMKKTIENEEKHRFIMQHFAL